MLASARAHTSPSGTVSVMLIVNGAEAGARTGAYAVLSSDECAVWVL